MRTSNRRTKPALALLAAAALAAGVTVTGPASTASAAPADRVITAPAELAMRQVASWTGADGSTGTASLSDPVALTTAQVQALGNPEMMAVAAAGGTIYSKKWSQDYVHPIPGPWQETHSGKYYYDGAKAWISPSYRGYQGNHNCDLGYSVGVDIKITDCTHRPISTNGVAAWDYFKTCTTVIKVICTSHNMHANLYSKGGVFFYWDS